MDELPPATTYHLITRHPKINPPTTIYQRLPETAPPFGLDRSPSFQFMQRLRGFPPNLDDVVVVASTASADIGLITRSKVPLAGDVPAEKISNVFTTTAMAEDSRRAQMPMNEELADTSPIGVGFDLSSKDKVERPLPKEEYEASQGPLPALMILNNEGILSAWWFVYAESIRQGTTFPGLVVAGGIQASQPSTTGSQSSPFTNASPSNAPAFGKSAFGTPSNAAASPFALGFGKPSALGSGAPPGSAFGAPSAFGTASQSQGPTFGQAAFGGMGASPSGSTTQGLAFGMTGGMGMRSSPWGTASTGTMGAGLGASKPNPFGAPSAGGNAPNSSGGFSAFASKPSGFMAVTSSSGSASIFSQPTSSAPLGSGTDTTSSFGISNLTRPGTSNSPFGGSGGFTLGSTFARNASTADDEPKSGQNAGGSMFGGGFSDALGAAQKENAPQTKDEDMDGNDHPPVEDQPAPSEKSSTSPAAARDSFPPASVPPKVGGLFGTQSQSKTTPAAVGTSLPTGFTFGNPGKSSTSPDTTPQKADQPQPSVETSPRIKEEPTSDDGGISPLNEHESAPPLGYTTPETSPISRSPEPPLPPESTSKASFAPGDSSNSSKSSDDAPLPPDFLPSKTKLKQVEAAPPAEAALPSEDGDVESGELTDQGSFGEEDEGTDEESGNLDEEGSGVDVAQEVSPSSGSNQSSKITPGSSFGAPPEKNTRGDLFERISAPPTRQNGQQLFGEVGKTSAPYLPPPSKSQQSPRSPSPVRLNRLGDTLRPDNARSISAPGPFQALNNRKAGPSRTIVPDKPQPSPEEIREQVRKQMVAEQARAKEEEEQDLSDHEDERVREELETEVEGTLELDPFLAHQDYVGGDIKPGIPGQIEKVYRDINSMIDTLGLNSRSLKAFTKGHQESDGARTREDLEKGNWCLDDVEGLSSIENDIFVQLENCPTKDASQNIAGCRDLRKEVANLRAKGVDVVRAVDARSDPDEVESARKAPLSLDQATQQHDLRKKMAKFQKLLAEAEENITMLRTKLASCNTSNGKGPPLKKPTVEAVNNTIRKMTSIVEKKNSDIEALENQMRYLRFSSTTSISSREGSPFTSASPHRKAASKFGASTNGNRHSPSRSIVLGRSMNGDETPRNGIADFTSEDKQRYRDKARRRQEINEIMKREFGKDRLKVRALD